MKEENEKDGLKLEKLRSQHLVPSLHEKQKDWCWSWSSNTLATDVKSWLIRKDPDAGKDWGKEKKGMTEDEMVR